MELDLSGRVAIVTGGSRGIGKAVATELAREGVAVAVCARHYDVLEDAAKTIEKETGSSILPVKVDTTNGSSVHKMVEYTVKTLGKIDILVNNAAVPGGLVQGPLEDSDEEALLEDINTKVVGYFRCAKAVAPHMRSQGWGRIINIGGLSARQSGNISGLRNVAIVHLTKTLSDQLGPDGITVNLVHPGATRTERTTREHRDIAQRQGISVEEAQERITRNIPIGRMIDAKEVGYVVTFLASSKASAVTGEVISAGGGSGRAVFQ